jgi:hypothetical protein
MNIFFRQIALLLICFYVFSAYGQIGGNYVYRFLSIGNASQIEAAGGKTVAYYSPEINMIADNPAYSFGESSTNLALNYTHSFTQINTGSSFYKLDSNWTVGIQFVHYGDFTKADENGNRYEKFSLSDYAFILNYSREIAPKLAVGLNVKPVLSNYYPNSSYGIASDWGVYYTNNEKLLWAGFVIKNLGVQIKPYNSGNFEKLPLEINAGIAKKLAHAPFAVHLSFHDLQSPQMRYTISNPNILLDANSPSLSRIEQIGDNILRHSVLGWVIFPDKKLNILMGYNYQRRTELSISTRKGLTGFSLGFNLKKKNFVCAYNYANYHLAGGEHQISILLNTTSNYLKMFNYNK